MIPASRAVTTAGARRFAPSKSILIRLVEFRRTEARHSDTTFETKKISIIAFNEERCCYLIWSNFHSLLDGHVKPATWSNYFLCSHRHDMCPNKPGQIAGQNFLASLLGTKNATKGSERLGTARFKSGKRKLKQGSTFCYCRESRVLFLDQFLDHQLVSYKGTEYSCWYSDMKLANLIIESNQCVKNRFFPNQGNFRWTELQIKVKLNDKFAPVWNKGWGQVLWFARS